MNFNPIDGTVIDHSQIRKKNKKTNLFTRYLESEVKAYLYLFASTVNIGAFFIFVTYIEPQNIINDSIEELRTTEYMINSIKIEYA